MIRGRGIGLGAPLLIGMALAGILWADAARGESELGVCIPVAERFRENRSDEALLAVATDEWYSTSAIRLPGYDSREMGVNSLGVGRYRAQRFVAVMAGEGARHGVGAGQTFLVFPFDHDSSCRLRPLSRWMWVPPGDTVTFLLRPEDRGLAPGGEPMFPQWTFKGPYPLSSHASALPRGERDPHERTGREFFEWMHQLPPAAAPGEGRR